MQADGVVWRQKPDGSLRINWGLTFELPHGTRDMHDCVCAAPLLPVVAEDVDEVRYRHQPHEPAFPRVPQRRRLHIWCDQTRPYGKRGVEQACQNKHRKLKNWESRASAR